MKYRLLLWASSAIVLACGSDADGALTDGGMDGAREEAGIADAGLDASPDAAPVELDTRYLPIAKSGSRLQPIVFEVEGAPDVFAGWHDSELGIDCQPRPALDGVIRCLPTHSVRPTTVRLSENCTGGSGLLDRQDCGPTTYDLLGEVLSDDLATCANNGLGIRVQSWTSEPWTGAYSSMDSGECVAFPEAPTGAVALLASSVEAPVGFVAFSYRFEKLDSGLQVRIEEGEDGASRVMGLYNDDGQACSLRPLERGAHYCVPSEVAFEEGSGTYLDSECTQLAVFVSSSHDVECTGEPRYGLVRNEGSDIYELGMERTGDDMVYVRDGDTCVARSVTALKSQKPHVGRIFEVSDKLASLPRLRPVSLGEGPIRARYYATAQGVVAHETYEEVLSFSGSGIRTRTPYEVEGEGCVVWQTSEAGARCIPSVAALNVFEPRYADDACTDRVAYVGTWLTLAGEDPQLVYEVEQTECVHPQGAGLSTSEVVVGLWRVTGKIEAGSQTIYEREGDGCSESDVGEEVHFTIEAIDPTTYPQLDLVTRAP